MATFCLLTGRKWLSDRRSATGLHMDGKTGTFATEDCLTEKKEAMMASFFIVEAPLLRQGNNILAESALEGR